MDTTKSLDELRRELEDLKAIVSISIVILIRITFFVTFNKSLR